MSDTLLIFGTQYSGVDGFKATDNNNQTKTFIRPQGTKSITSNGTNIDVYDYAVANVSVSSPSVTQHTIHLEFSDNTDTDITVYYNDSLIGTMITAYGPSTWTYNNKTIYVAQLDNVTWYDVTPASETWETIWDGNVGLLPSSGGYPYFNLSGYGSSYPLAIGDVWRVTYDNVQYRLTCDSTYANFGIIGNQQLIGLGNSGSEYPIVIVSPYNGNIQGRINLPNEATTVYVKIEQLIT